MNWLQALNILILPCPICGEQHTAVDAIDRGCLDKLRDIPELLPLRPAGSVVNASSSRPPENGGEGTAEMGVRAVVLLAWLKNYEEKALAIQETLGEGNQRSWYAGMSMAYQIAQETVTAWLDGDLG